MSRVWKIDLSLAVVVAVVLVIVSPGLAMVGVIALVALVLCLLSYGGENLLERRRRRRELLPRRLRHRAGSRPRTR